jgi:predicted aminopeptidase
VIGKFSYKGFFDLEKAKALKAELDQEGWDTGIRTVSAWSTLGWFKDPLMSNMLNRTEGDLANTIIHELTHGTVFVKDSLRFNENLASFIGDEGAQLFLTERYGPYSKELINYQQGNEDQERFTNYVLLACHQLDSLYKSWGPEIEPEEKRLLKADLMSQFKSNIDTVDFNLDRYEDYFKKRELNNTFFLSYKRYRSKQVDFKKSLVQEFDGNLTLFLNYYKKNYPSL